jgi:hypothetical protein
MEVKVYGMLVFDWFKIFKTVVWRPLGGGVCLRSKQLLNDCIFKLEIVYENVHAILAKR